MKVAIVSLLAKPRMKRHEINYFVGFHHLVESLKRHHTQLPPIIVLSPDLKQPPPGADGIEGVRIENYRKIANVQKAFGKSVYFKLDVFRMNFDRVVFLDADVLALKNVSELWNPNSFNAAGLYAIRESTALGLSNPDWQGRLNTGVMVINRPFLTGAHYQRLLQLAHDGATYDHGDQGVVNAFVQTNDMFNNVGELSPRYNLPSCARVDGDWQRFSQDIGIVHFLGPRKPWMNEPEHRWHHHDIQKLWDEEVKHHAPLPKQHPALQSSLHSRIVRAVQRYEEWRGKG